MHLIAEQRYIQNKSQNQLTKVMNLSHVRSKSANIKRPEPPAKPLNEDLELENGPQERHIKRKTKKKLTPTTRTSCFKINNQNKFRLNSKEFELVTKEGDLDQYQLVLAESTKNSPLRIVEPDSASGPIDIFTPYRFFVETQSTFKHAPQLD